MSSQQIPSVGRAVHYLSRGSSDGVFRPECRAATITEVAPGSDVVGLCVANPTGHFFDRAVDFGPELTRGTWHWPGRDGDCEAGQ